MTNIDPRFLKKNNFPLQYQTRLTPKKTTTTSTSSATTSNTGAQLPSASSDYASGKTTSSDFAKIIKSAGGTISKNGQQASISEGGKTYTVSSNSNLLATRHWEKKECTYADLKNVYKFSDTVINKYFDKVPQVLQAPVSDQFFNDRSTFGSLDIMNARSRGTHHSLSTGSVNQPSNLKNTELYKLKEDCGFTTIEELVAHFYDEYKNSLILANYLNGINIKSDRPDDYSKTENGTQLTEKNYSEFVDEISVAEGDKAEEIRQRALNKLIKDFTSGDIAYSSVSTVLEAIGVKNTSMTFTPGGKQYCLKFTYGNKTYSLYCLRTAADSGKDEIRVATYTADDLNNSGASQKLLDEYFTNAASIDGKTSIYILREGKTYAEFENALNAELHPAKNGEYTTTNANGQKVIETYKDGVKTKEVVYQENGICIESETEYYENGNVKRRVENKKGTNSPICIMEYDENGQVKHKETYNYYYDEVGLYGCTAKDISENGKTTERYVYNRAGQLVKKYTYAEDGTTKETRYDGNGNVIIEFDISADGNSATAKTSSKNSDGTTTVQYWSAGRAYNGWQRSSILESEEKYDSSERLIYRATYNERGDIDSEIIYNSDGSRTEIEYGEHWSDGTRSEGTIWKPHEKTYDESNRLIKEVKLNSLGGTVVVIYDYDENGLTTITTIGPRNEKTVTDKNGNLLYTIIYDYPSEIEDKIEDPGEVRGQIYTKTTYNGTKTTKTVVFNGKTIYEVVTDSSNNTRTVVVDCVYEETHKSARSKLTGSYQVTKYGVTVRMTAKEIYDAITNLDRVAVTVAGVKNYTGARIVQMMAGDISLEMLRMAQAGYDKTPSGCDQKYGSYQDAPANVQEFIKNDIQGALQEEYGYAPEDVKGYHYPSSSNIAKTMAADSDCQNFVKKNIRDLINGTNLKGKRLDFNKNKDLWGSFHGVDIVSTKLEGTMLTLTIYDLYDFDSSLTGNSGNAVLNRAGAAAMKDGKLVPYFTLIDVVIDLSKSPYNYTAEQLQSMKS